MTNGADSAHTLSAQLRVLRASQDRVLEREGIPMVLALVNEVGPPPQVVDERAASEGSALAEAMDDYRAALVPSSRDDDLGCLISVLQAVSYADFAGTGGRLDEDDVAVATKRVGA